MQPPVLGNQWRQGLEVVIKNKGDRTHDFSVVIVIGQSGHDQLLLVVFHDVEQQGPAGFDHLRHTGMGDELTHRFANDP